MAEAGRAADEATDRLPAETVAAKVTFVAFGDAALLISAATDRSAGLASWSGMVAAAIDDARLNTPAIGRPVPTHASILVPFDPLALDLDDAIRIARDATASVANPPQASATKPDPGAAWPPLVEIAVRYGGADGPDLDLVSDAVGLRPADVVELHAEARYRVLFLGFAPGFAYLGGLPSALVMARRRSPRERVPAGSVAIAGEETAVYPLAMPGGWRLIGRTDAVLFDPGADPPARLRAGMEVRFVPVTRT